MFFNRIDLSGKKNRGNIVKAYLQLHGGKSFLNWGVVIIKNYDIIKAYYYLRSLVDKAKDYALCISRFIVNESCYFGNCYHGDYCFFYGKEFIKDE